MIVSMSHYFISFKFDFMRKPPYLYKHFCNAKECWNGEMSKQLYT